MLLSIEEPWHRDATAMPLATLQAQNVYMHVQCRGIVSVSLDRYMYGVVYTKSCNGTCHDMHCA